MQSWKGCPSLAVGESVTLEDIRDNRKYAVKKLPDGKCWMVQNLALGMNATEKGLTLTPDDTNIDNGTIYYLPPTGKQGSSTMDDPSTITAADAANFAEDSSVDQHAKTQFRTKDSSIVNDSDTGYYNFYTATLGFSYHGDGVSSGSSTRDICPKGWRLPWSSDSVSATAADFYGLATSYNSDASWSFSSNMPYTQDSAIHAGIHTELSTSDDSYAGFVYSGNLGSTGNISLGLYGYYWSSSVNYSTSSNGLLISASDVYPYYASVKSEGQAIRCVVRDTRTLSDIAYMQEVNSDIVTNTATNAYKQLLDKRGDSKYYVKKLADGKFWMVQNLRLVGSRKLTSSDSSVFNSFTITASTATPSASTWCATNSSDCVNKTLVYYNSSEASNNKRSSYYGALYNWYTATAGTGTYGTNANITVFSSICPKGWHLPKGGADVSANEFSILDRAWGGTGENNQTNRSTYSIFTGAYTSADNGGFGLAGYIFNGSINDVSSYGNYWSSSASSAGSSVHALYLISDNTKVSPMIQDSKYGGKSIRCVAAP